MADITDRYREYNAKLVGHSCNICQMGRIPNPQLGDILLPTEAYFKTYVDHNDSAINSSWGNPLPILCEVQRKVRCLKDGITPEEDREDYTLFRRLQARTQKAGLYHNDDAPRQTGVPSGKRYAVYIDLGGMSGTVKVPKRSPSSGRSTMPGKTLPRSPNPTLQPKTYGGDGVLIKNAEISALNGWYRKRDNTVRPVNAQAHNLATWRRWNGDRQWYQKDDNCYIVWYQSGASSGWFLRDAGGKNRYVNYDPMSHCKADQQWLFWNSADAEALGVAKPRYGRAMSKLVARTS